MKLLDLISANQNLRFVDATEDREYSFSELRNHFQLPEFPGKKLVFIYAKNDFHSLAAFFSVWGKDTAIALLPAEMKEEFKSALETIYHPHFVFDDSRKSIQNYVENNGFFSADRSLDFPIHVDVKLLLSTSGTTGSPKFVKLSEENVVQNALSILNYLPIHKDQNVPLNLPFHYSFGLSVLTTNCIGAGRVIFGTGDVLQRNFWNYFEKYEYNSLAGVPYVYEMLHRTGFTKKEYPSLQYLIQAGGKLGDNLIDEFANYCSQRSKQFFVMYGQTEATARMSYLPPDKMKSKRGSVGIAIRGGRFTIDENTGELCYSGPNVFGGYVESPGDLNFYSPPAALRTGDVANIDTDGFVYITGRLKRMIKITGTRINLDEVEWRLKEHFSGEIFAVTGEADKKLLVFCANPEIGNEAVTEYLRNYIGIHPAFVRVAHTENIPLTANGKPNYAKLLELAAS